MNIETKINSIPVVPKKEKEEKFTIWNLEEIITQKPRRSVKEIDEAYKVFRFFSTVTKNKKLKSYNCKFQNDAN